MLCPVLCQLIRNFVVAMVTYHTISSTSARTKETLNLIPVVFSLYACTAETCLQHLQLQLNIHGAIYIMPRVDRRALFRI